MGTYGSIHSGYEVKKELFRSGTNYMAGKIHVMLAKGLYTEQLEGDEPLGFWERLLLTLMSCLSCAVGLIDQKPE